MGKPSRDKGKRGEREAAAEARRLWAAPDARRSRQVDGGLTSDLVNALPQAHVEVKRRRNLAVARFLDQADEDRRAHEYPVVLMREDGGPWLVLLRMEDSLRFAQSLAENHHSDTLRP